jgi:hypothetical protein
VNQTAAAAAGVQPVLHKLSAAVSLCFRRLHL